MGNVVQTYIRIFQCAPDMCGKYSSDNPKLPFLWFECEGLLFGGWVREYVSSQRVGNLMFLVFYCFRLPFYGFLYGFEMGFL